MNGQVISNLIFDCVSEREDKLTQFYTSMKQYKSSSRVVKGTNWAGQKGRYDFVFTDYTER